MKTPAPGYACGARAGARIGQSGKAIRPHAKTANTRRGPSFLKIAARHRSRESAKCRGTAAMVGVNSLVCVSAYHAPPRASAF